MASSRSNTAHNHSPSTPSGLRQSRTVSLSPASTSSDKSNPNSPGPSNHHQEDQVQLGETTSLLHHDGHGHGHGHGTFSPRTLSPPLRGIHVESERASLADSEGSLPASETRFLKGTWKKTLSNKFKSKKMATSSALAERHGFEDSWWMYISYYVPCLTWMSQYQWSWLKGDFVAAITMASMYLPMALSYADNLAHIPPISGLYAFVFNPFIYAILGSCPQMIVGPEAAGSLLIGSIVKNNIDLGRGQDDNAVLQSQIAGVAVGIAGASVFIMGLGRFGFVDNVLSRPFLRGFISSIGVVIFIDQLTPVLGLNKTAHNTPGVPHGSTVTKLVFVLTHLGDRHTLSAIVGGVSFAIIMVLR